MLTPESARGRREDLWTDLPTLETLARQIADVRTVPCEQCVSRISGKYPNIKSIEPLPPATALVSGMPSK